MRLRGVLEFSLGGFLCMRGYAPLGVLRKISHPDASFQRDADPERVAEITTYLEGGKYLFFPEVILCVAAYDETRNVEGRGPDWEAEIASLWEAARRGTPWSGGAWPNGVRLRTTVQQSRKSDDLRAVQYFQVGMLTVNDESTAHFSRIDGNHRLDAAVGSRAEERVAPYCIVFFQNMAQYEANSRVLFHTINYKHVPLKKEHNLRLILEDTALFDDETLLNDPSFGWPYYQARKLSGYDLDGLAYVAPIVKETWLTFLVELLTFLVNENVLSENDNSIKRFKEAIASANALLETSPAFAATRNNGLLAALLYFILENKNISRAVTFVNWVAGNHLYAIPDSDSAELVAIFSKIIESRKRTIFVSMKYNTRETEDHYEAIERVAEEITETHHLNPPLRVQRVDANADGTSFVIKDRILAMIAECGYFIGDLTYGNPNVYHEIGFVMGKAHATADAHEKMLLILNESVADENKAVGFNLQSYKQIRFTQIVKELVPKLRENIERFYGLRQD